eukprot:GDKK01014482.1.p1 GENE.GDKK01014482.1~~GDKK01014482.1.p1  ORF type:complete len:406 (-),score=23.21 GDKK01014482.1:94-1311(-)
MIAPETHFTAFSKKVQTFIIENFLLVGFCGAVIFAFAYPFGGKLFYSWKTGDYRIIELLNNCFVFFISGLTLKLEDLKTVTKHKFPVLYSLVTINFVTTLLSFGLIRIPFIAKDFAIGLTIFCTVPTTLGVGVALTLLAKGDQIMSLFLTVVSNLLGIVTVPFLLGIYMSHSNAISIDPVRLAMKMTITVLVPTVVGMLTRKFVPGVPAFTKAYRNELSMISTFNLIMIVWMALSSARNTLLAQNAGDILLVLLLGVLMHLLFLVCNALVVSKYMLNFAPRQAVSVIIMASQKSSPVALAVITSLVTDTPEQKGLFALPCIVGQLSQIFIGSFVASRLAAWVNKQEDPAPTQIAGDISGSIEFTVQDIYSAESPMHQSTAQYSEVITITGVTYPIKSMDDVEYCL